MVEVDPLSVQLVYSRVSLTAVELISAWCAIFQQPADIHTAPSLRGSQS